MSKALSRILPFCILFFLIDIYFWQSFKHNFLFSFQADSLAIIIYGAITFLSIIGAVYTTFHFNSPNAPKKLILLQTFILSLYLSKFLGILPLIIDDIIRSIKWTALLFTSSNETIHRMVFLKNTSILIAIALFSLLLYGTVFGRFNFKKKKISLKLNKWPSPLNGLKIIHISDLHIGSFTSNKPTKKIVDLINQEEPDLIVFTGDIVNNNYWEVDDHIEVLSQLKAKYGKYAILGNHDYGDYLGLNKNSPKEFKIWKHNLNEIIKVHEKIGFDLLLNENRIITINEHSFNLIGVENWGVGFSQYGDFNKSIQELDPNKCNILLSHDPSHWEHEVINHTFPIELQLAGHTHGMQFGIEWGKLKWSPVQFKYPQWGGLYEKLGKKLYVNRGLGHHGYAGRVGIYPEITVLTLRN